MGQQGGLSGPSFDYVLVNMYSWERHLSVLSEPVALTEVLVKVKDLSSSCYVYGPTRVAQGSSRRYWKESMYQSEPWGGAVSNRNYLGGTGKQCSGSELVRMGLREIETG